jgi:hypothetical protein
VLLTFQCKAAWNAYRTEICVDRAMLTHMVIFRNFLTFSTAILIMEIADRLMLYLTHFHTATTEEKSAQPGLARLQSLSCAARLG